MITFKLTHAGKPGDILRVLWNEGVINMPDLYPDNIIFIFTQYHKPVFVRSKGGGFGGKGRVLRIGKKFC